MGLREANWHQEVIWKRVGIEDKATHEGVSYMVGHIEFWGEGSRLGYTMLLLSASRGKLGCLPSL